MPTHQVNLDALIRREDFESADTEDGVNSKPLFKIEELAPNRMYFSVLRKPAFQRPTNNWTSEMIVSLVESYLDGALVPALILWHSRVSGKIFIIDGAHRLSALVAWVNDDYGNGSLSRKFYEGDISPAQVRLDQATRELMNARVGSYESVYRAGLNPIPEDPTEKIRRGRAIATVQPPIQEVTGDAETAERSFVKINENPAKIDPTDLDVLRARAKPNTIAARALMRFGTPYFDKMARANEIKTLSDEVYRIIFGQIVDMGTQSPDIPKAGIPYSSDAFEMVLDMINIFNGITDSMWKESRAKKPKANSEVRLPDDVDGSLTIQYLNRVKEVGALVSDNGKHDSGSLGFDPAVYAYGATGKFHPAAFLASMRFAEELREKKKLIAFTSVRRDFEEFLVTHKDFINQLVHTKGGGTRPLDAVLTMFQIVFECFVSGNRNEEEIVSRLRQEEKLKALNDVSNLPTETITKRRRFSKTVQLAAVLRSILENRERCKECDARLPPSCRSQDHNVRQIDGGTGSLFNHAFTHPFCNSGYKEYKTSRARTSE